MRLFAIFLFIGSFLSCKNDKKDLVNNLTGGNKGKYWDLVKMSGFYDKDSSKVYPLYCYYFNDKKQRLFYQYNKGQRKKYEMEDILIPENWDFVSDTSILLGNKIYKIEKLTSDTFAYSDQSRYIILSKSLK